MLKIGIVGYGNLGKACERIAHANPDRYQLAAVFTRRNPSTMTSPFDTPFAAQSDLEKYVGKIDVLALCTGSANDLTELGLRAAKSFNTVDSFDTHAKMREYASRMERVASDNDHLSFIAIGWDPGLFSIMRCLFGGVLNDGSTYTFWGRGVSQGHSEALRRMDGVETAVQYTIPKEDALAAVRSGSNPVLSTRDKHLRECFVVAKDGADKAAIEAKIKAMPNYFDEYDTIVHFISREEFERNHTTMPHGGFVMRTGESNDRKQMLEFSLKLDSNPDFTAGVLMNYLQANARLYAKGERGVRTAIDIPVSALCEGDKLDNIAKFV